MKHIISLLSLIGLAAVAGEHASITIRPSSSVASNATAVVTNAIATSGKVLSISASSVGGSSTVSVYTVSNIGSSHGAAKTLLPAIVVAPGGLVTNLASPVYLGSDRLVALFGNATVQTSSVAPVVTIIYEK